MHPKWINGESLAMVAQPLRCRAMCLRMRFWIEEHDQALRRRAVEAVVDPSLSDHPFIVVRFVFWVSKRI